MKKGYYVEVMALDLVTVHEFQTKEFFKESPFWILGRDNDGNTVLFSVFKWKWAAKHGAKVFKKMISKELKKGKGGKFRIDIGKLK